MAATPEANYLYKVFDDTKFKAKMVVPYDDFLYHNPKQLDQLLSMHARRGKTVCRAGSMDVFCRRSLNVTLTTSCACIGRVPGTTRRTWGRPGGGLVRVWLLRNFTCHLVAVAELQHGALACKLPFQGR